MALEFFAPALTFYFDSLLTNDCKTLSKYELGIEALNFMSPTAKLEFSKLYRAALAKRLLAKNSDSGMEEILISKQKSKAMVGDSSDWMLRMIEETTKKQPILSGSIWPTPYKSKVCPAEITEQKIKSAVESRQKNLQKSAEKDQLVYCWHAASRVVLNKPVNNLVLNLLQFEVFKKLAAKKFSVEALNADEIIIAKQLQRPGFPKSNGALLQSDFSFNKQLKSGSDFAVNADLLNEVE